DAEGELPPTCSGMSEESPMGRRDGRWGEVDGEMSSKENVGSSVGEGRDEGDSFMGEGVEE
ncbi:hypothetical protein KI387_031253, partial [Taxus chinensis]